MVDRVDPGRVQIIRRVAAYRGEVDDRIESIEVVRLDVANVLASRRDSVTGFAESAVRVVEGVQSRDLMATGSKHRNHH
jgi:hypothetical protein